MPPKTSYTNKDLRFPAPAKDQVRDVAFWAPDDVKWLGRGKTATVEPDYEGDPLAEAKQSLEEAERFGAETGSAGISTLPERAAALGESNKPSLTGAMQAAGLPLLLGSSLTGPAAPLALGAGTALAVPELLRQLIAPEEGESRAGAAGMGALYALPYAGRAVQGLRALRGRQTAQKVYQTAREAFESGATKTPRAGTPFEGDRTWLWKNEPQTGTRWGQQPTKFGLGREVPYQVPGGATDPNQVLAIAQQVATETGVDINTVLKGYFRSGGTEPGRKEALTALLRSKRTTPSHSGGGLEDLRQSVRKYTTQKEQLAQDLQDASNLRGPWGGDRTTGSWPIEPGQGGLADAAAGSIPPVPYMPPPGATAGLRSLREPSSTRMEELLRRFGGRSR